MTTMTSPHDGPWSVYNNRIESRNQSRNIARAFTEMSDFVHNIPVIYPPERLANLRLMAAAPEMKEVIERLLYWLEVNNLDRLGEDGPQFGAVKEAHRVLSKGARASTRTQRNRSLPGLNNELQGESIAGTDTNWC